MSRKFSRFCVVAVLLLLLHPYCILVMLRRRRVFQIFLQGLKITFSRLKWNQICHEIDRNADDDISYDELLLFTFPNSNVVQEPEKRRLHNIGQAMRERLAMMYSDVYLEECKE